jgi:DNA-directed RNA polymerase specialized sigma subunit
MNTWKTHPYYEGKYNPSHGLINNSGKETQHTCAPWERDMCPAAATNWRDHCHAFGLLVAAQAGDRRAENDLIVYFTLPMEVNFAHKAFTTAVPQAEKRSTIQLAIMRLIRTYDPTSGVPFTAYLRKFLCHRIADIYRVEDKAARKSLAFDKKLAQAMASNPHLTVKEAAESLIGEGMTAEKLEGNYRHWVAAPPRSSLVLGSTGGVLHLEHATVMEMASNLCDPEAKVIAEEERANTMERLRIIQRTAGITEDDLLLVQAFVDGDLDAVAKTIGIPATRATERAIQVLTALQTANATLSEKQQYAHI